MQNTKKNSNGTKKSVGKSRKGLIYQYLPFSSFKKMITNKTIKLSNIRNSNDTTELDYGRDVYKDVIFDTLSKRKDITTADKKQFIKEFNKKVKYIDTFNTALQHGQFISCFSKNGDLLSQWRGYAQEPVTTRDTLTSILNEHSENVIDLNKTTNGGVSVGFSKEYIEKITSNNEILNSSDTKYTKRSQRKYFKDNAEMLIDGYKKYLDGVIIENDFWDGCLIEYENTLIKDARYMKDSFFREENEYRVCYWGSFSDMKIKYKLIGTTAQLSNESFIDDFKKQTSEEPKGKKNKKINIY